MIDQYRVELRRLLHRQLLFVLAIFSVIVLFVVGLSIWASTGPEERYVFNQGTAGAPQESFEVAESTFCPSALVTSKRVAVQVLDDVAYSSAGCPESTPSEVPGTATYAEVQDPYHPWNGSIGYFTIGALALLWLLAASLVGEEFRHGTVETALVAEPRRARLLAVRLAAVLTVGVGTYLVAAAGFLVANVPAWVLNGIDGATVSPTALMMAVGRGAIAAALVVAISASLAVIGRGTLLSLGVLVGLAVVTAALFLFVRALIPLEFFTNLYGIVTGGDGIRAFRSPDPWFEGSSVVRFGAGWPWIATVAVVSAYAVVAVAGAFALFTHRDIR